MRPERKPARVVRVVRHGENATYIWDRKPNRQDCKTALLSDPPCRPRVGHCWPGFDDPPYTQTPANAATNRTRRPAPDPAHRPTGDAGQDGRVRYTGVS